jgi:hypothetical protein
MLHVLAYSRQLEAGTAGFYSADAWKDSKEGYYLDFLVNEWMDLVF